MFDKVSRVKDYACIKVEGSRDLPGFYFCAPPLISHSQQTNGWRGVVKQILATDIIRADHQSAIPEQKQMIRF